MKIRSIISAAFVICISLIAQPAFAQGSWTTGAPDPIPGYFSGTGVINGLLYLAGGGNEDAKQALQTYDPSTNSWGSGASLPFKISDQASGVINGKLVEAEGWVNADSNSSTTAVEIYDPVTDSWSSGAPASVARGDTANAVVGDKLYITGGRASVGQGPFNSLEIYDALTNSWSLGASVPLATMNGIGAALGGKFYVISGSVSSTSLVLTGAVQIYDPSSDTWSTGASMPTPLAAMTGGVINGRLYVTSGVTATGDRNSTLQIYDPVSDVWTTGPSAPVGRYGGSSAAVGSALYVTGGIDSNGGFLAELDIFSVQEYSAQVQPPINADGSSVFKANRGVVPVKFTLTLNGVATCDLPPATIAVTRTAGGTLGTVNESVYSGSADSGSNFRIDSCQYVYNLNSSALGVGTYRVDIIINGQVVGSAVFQLK